MRKDTHKFCRSCRTCQTTKKSTRRNPGLLHPLPTLDTLWSSIAMDFTGPFPMSLGYCQGNSPEPRDICKHVVFKVTWVSGNFLTPLTHTVKYTPLYHLRPRVLSDPTETSHGGLWQSLAI